MIFSKKCEIKVCLLDQSCRVIMLIILFFSLSSHAEPFTNHSDLPRFARYANSCDEGAKSKSGFWKGDDFYCLYGMMHDGTLLKISSINLEQDSIVVVNSDGGLGIPSIKIAEIFFQKNITLILRGKCLSSCANYVFTASKFKFIFPSAIIGWHGSFTNYVNATATRELTEEAHQGWILQKNLFQKIGVNMALIRFRPKSLGPDPVMDASGSFSGEAFWSYTTNEMKCFGIDGLLTDAPFLGFPLPSADCRRLVRTVGVDEEWHGVVARP